MHLQSIYNGPEVPAFPEGPTDRSEDFTVEELRAALHKGHLRKSVGIDMVPHELLVAIGKSEEGANLLVQWFNRLLHREETFPESWGKVFMILIPKIPQPKTPKHLRPICLAAAADKLYSRMLLERTRHALRYSGPAQTMGEGRQTTDYLWAVNRMMALEQEWRKGIWFIKLVLEKAFDRLDRSRFLQRLEAKLGRTEILHSWWSMLQNTKAELVTAWGRSEVGMRSGIRQGAVESPQMFSTAIDWVLEEVAREMGWDPARDVYEGLGVAEVAFVDDMLLWNGTKQGLGQRVEELRVGLQGWGLLLNIQKCQIYVSPYSIEKGPLHVAGGQVEVDDLPGSDGSSLSGWDQCQGSLGASLRESQRAVLGDEISSESGYSVGGTVEAYEQSPWQHGALELPCILSRSSLTTGNEYPPVAACYLDHEALQGKGRGLGIF